LKNWKYILEGKSFLTSWTAYDSDATLVSNGAFITSLSLADSAPGAFVMSNAFTLTAGQVISGRVFVLNSGDDNFVFALNNKATADDTAEAFDVDTFLLPTDGSHVFTLTATTAGTYRIYIRRAVFDDGTHSFDSGRFSFSDQLILTHTPAGWDKKTIAFIRNEFYNTILRNLSLSLRFVFEGKDYIKARYDANGINDVISIYIQRRDPLLDTFSDYYTGILDLSKIKLTRDFCEIPVIDNQILAKFISRDDMDLNLNELKTVDNETITDFSGGFEQYGTIDGVDIITQSLKSLREEETIVFTTQAFDYNSPDKFPPLASFTYDVNENPDDAITDKATFKLYTNNDSVNQEISVDVFINIAGTMTVTSGTYARIYIKSWIYTTGSPTPEWLINYSLDGITGTQVINIDEDSVSNIVYYTLAPGDSVYFKMNAGASDTIKVGSVSANLEAVDVDIDIRKYIYNTFSIRQVFLPHEVLNRLLQKTTNPLAVLDSDIIGRISLGYGSDGEFAYHSLCSGYMLRDFSLTQKPFSLSVREFFKSLNDITPIGLWYNETLNKWELNPIENYYKNTVIITLGEVKDFERSVDERYFFNSIKAGYNNQISYENKGINNFNCNFEFSNNITTVKNVKNLQSNFRADDYGIQYTIQNSDKTKESNSDNNIFWVVLDSGLKTIQGSDFVSVTGLFNWASRFNFGITPKRNLLRHGLELAVTFWKETTGKIKYQKSQYNQTLSTQATGEPSLISELADIDLSDLPEPLYHPEVYNFKAPVTADQIAQLMTDPHGIVKFYYLGVEYQGYIMEVSTEPIDRQGNWILIKANTSR